MNATEWLKQWSERHAYLKESCCNPSDEIITPVLDLYRHEQEYEQRVKKSNLNYGGRLFFFYEVKLDNGVIQTSIDVQEMSTFYMDQPKSYKLLYGKDDVGVFVLKSLENDRIYSKGPELTPLGIAMAVTECLGKNVDPYPNVPVD